MGAAQDIYMVERELRELFRAAMKRGSTTIDMFGMTIDLPKKLDFDSMQEIQSYINTKIFSNPHIVKEFGDIPYVRVKESNYLNMSQHDIKGRIIRIAPSDIGMSIATVVHEASHAIVNNASHGDDFRRAYLGIYDVIAGPSMVWALQVMMHQESKR